MAIVPSGGGDLTYVCSSVSSSQTRARAAAPRFLADLRLAAPTRRLAAGRRFAAGRRLALVERFPVVHRFAVARRFAESTLSIRIQPESLSYRSRKRRL